jgi:4-hydroxybenzoyl-CoA thioesterase
MGFEFPQKILFKHCDPAGIVFYPRYFEMINDCVEHFFDEALNVPFQKLHENNGIPTAQIETKFAAPSHHGDTLILDLQIAKVGRSSATYRMTAKCGSQHRFETNATIVHIDTKGRSTPWPDALRSSLIAFKDDPNDS